MLSIGFMLVFAVGTNADLASYMGVSLPTDYVGKQIEHPEQDVPELALLRDEEPAEQLTEPMVQGRLKQNRQFWQETLGAPDYIVSIVSNGYVLPLLVTPPSLSFRNHSSALQHSSFVQNEIEKLQKGRCIVPCSECPYVCNPLLVVPKALGKNRLVIDLRYVNQFLRIEKFKYEGLALVPQMFGKGDYFCTFDLKSGYHHVDVHSQSWKYLGFS